MSAPELKTADNLRLRITIRGAVQGVGFRPFVYRLASEMNLTGWVSNTSQGVFIEVESKKNTLYQFLFRLKKEIPPRAYIQSFESSFLDPVGFHSFEIKRSQTDGIKTVLILPDIAVCPECLQEIFNPDNRRYLYPFTNCTNCGPRFSIIEKLPYDRLNTSMKTFTMCAACKAEYENPMDRRFHAQPNACPVCGPRMELWNLDGRILATEKTAFLNAAEIIRSGRVLAVKGIGGFHLVVDARNNDAVRRLRERKHREEKPLALMYPSLENVKQDCQVSELEEHLLQSPESPIVLLSRLFSKSFNSQVSDLVSPNNPYLGVMLPYSPVHHILMRELGFPVVATSGNISDEPICTDEKEALLRLDGIADVFLVHNRPIIRHVDDSIVRIMAGREQIVRRARGYAPLPITLKIKNNFSAIAVGAHLKNTVALKIGENTFVSQHIGDLETPQSLEAFQAVIRDFQTLYEITPTTIVCDMHPEYLSTKFAQSSKSKIIEVQHHYAHVASCMAENQIEDEVLGIAWDGTGFGTDGTIWGGEFLLVEKTFWTRVATLKSFPLIGGEKAIKEPRRTALGILFEIFGNDLKNKKNLLPFQSLPENEIDLMISMAQKKINCPVTTSVGRLFDAVASIIGLRQINRYEGQAAMELEFLIPHSESESPGRYEFEIENGSDSPHSESLLQINWKLMISAILEDLEHRVSPPAISQKFHSTLVEIIVALAKQFKKKRIILSGGCFQNRYLTEQTIFRLGQEGFQPYWHQRVPPNDGGIALGQIFAATRSILVDKK